MPAKPTREPIEPCKTCIEATKYGGYCPDHDVHYTNPTAQAGEACKTCGGTKWLCMDLDSPHDEECQPCPDCLGTGKVPAPPKEYLKAHEPYKGSSVDFGSHRKPKAAPPTPSAGEARTKQLENVAEKADAAGMKNLAATARKHISPQLPTPEGMEATIKQIMLDNFNPSNGVWRLAADKAAREIAKTADERFEAAISDYDEERTVGAEPYRLAAIKGRNKLRIEARQRWYEGDTQ